MNVFVACLIEKASSQSPVIFPDYCQHRHGYKKISALPTL